MSILFNDIYTKAIALFDDPKITQAYNTNMIQFQKIMYSYFQNAVMMFNNPLIITSKLININPPKGVMQTFESDGQNNIFTLDDNFELLDNSYYVFTEGELFITKGVNLNKENRTITFPDILPEGQEYSIEQYFPGEFLDEFKNFNTNTNKINGVVIESVKNILARLLIKCWAEGERNLLTDIRNIMQDSDFKIMDNSKILNAKNAWLEQIEHEITQYTNQLAWTIRFAGGSLNPGLGRG